MAFTAEQEHHHRELHSIDDAMKVEKQTVVLALSITKNEQLRI